MVCLPKILYYLYIKIIYVTHSHINLTLSMWCIFVHHYQHLVGWSGLWWVVSCKQARTYALCVFCMMLIVPKIQQHQQLTAVPISLISNYPAIPDTFQHFSWAPHISSHHHVSNIQWSKFAIVCQASQIQVNKNTVFPKRFITASAMYHIFVFISFLCLRYSYVLNSVSETK